MSDEAKRIHFVPEVEDLGAAYVCKRCGHATSTMVEMKQHRDGIITDCLKMRLKSFAANIRE